MPDRLVTIGFYSMPYEANLVRAELARLIITARRVKSIIFEIREDNEGEIVHLVTMWKSTKEEVRWYEENS